jgi:hypothetical protein
MQGLSLGSGGSDDDDELFKPKSQRGAGAPLLAAPTALCTVNLHPPASWQRYVLELLFKVAFFLWPHECRWFPALSVLPCVQTSKLRGMAATWMPWTAAGRLCQPRSWLCGGMRAPRSACATASSQVSPLEGQQGWAAVGVGQAPAVRRPSQVVWPFANSLLPLPLMSSAMFARVQAIGTKGRRGLRRGPGRRMRREGVARMRTRPRCLETLRILRQVNRHCLQLTVPVEICVALSGWAVCLCAAHLAVWQAGHWPLGGGCASRTHLCCCRHVCAPAGERFAGSSDPATRAAAAAIKASAEEELAEQRRAKKAAFDSEYDQGECLVFAATGQAAGWLMN